MNGKSFFDMVDELGNYFGGGRAYPPIERAQPLDKPIAQFRRKDLWPAEEWEKMQRILNGEEE